MRDDAKSCLSFSSTEWYGMLPSLISAALFIACLVQVTDYFNRLELLNVETLRMARAVLPFDNSIHSLSDGEIKNRPVKVVVITNEMFERDFDQASPLNRAKLTTLFNALLSSQNSPAVLAVDLDLSPSPAYPQVEKQFYANLKVLVKNSATQLILIIPMPTMLPTSIDRKLVWMREMCANGVHFALPDIVGVQNTVMNMPVGIPILGYEAYRVAKGLGDDYLPLQFGETVNTSYPYTVRRVCDYSDKELKGILQILGLQVPVTEAKGYQRINFKFPESIDLIRLSSLEKLKDGLEDLSGLRKSVVFLGGEYGSGDIYQTPVGPLSGMYLHVAAYYSTVFRVPYISKPVALIVDLITAILFFMLFLCVRNKMRNTEEITHRLFKALLPPILSFMAILSAAFALGWWNVWLHPAAVITWMGAYITVIYPSCPPDAIKTMRDSYMDRLLKYTVFYPVILSGLFVTFT